MTVPHHDLAMAVAKACNIPHENLTELSLDVAIDNAPVLRTAHIFTSIRPTVLGEIHQTWQPVGRGRTFTLFGRRIAIWKVAP